MRATEFLNEIPAAGNFGNRIGSTTDKIKEAIDLNKLVSDPTKLKTHGKYISPEEAFDRLEKGEKDEYLIHAVATDPQLAYYYATEVLDGPFPLGEPAIAKNAMYSYAYALHIEKPFPLGEPAIATDKSYSYRYARDVLKGRPWTGIKKKKVKEAIDLNKLVSDPSKLKTHGKYISPDEAYYRLEKGEKDEYLIHAVAKSPGPSYYYANIILKNKPFPLGEPAIAKDIWYSYQYAKGILKGPFPLGEPAIAKDAVESYWYARDVLKKPFPLGEPAIYRSDWKKDYETHVLKGKPWTGLNQKVDEALDLNKLVTDPTKLKTYGKYIGPREAYERLENGEKDENLLHAIAKSAGHSYYYAYNVLKKKPFTLGEPAIAKDTGYSYLYAKYVLEKPFPLGEPAIYNSPWKNKYEEDVLKGRPWTGLEQKVDEAIDLNKLVTDPTKLKTHSKYISPKEAYSRLKKGETDEYLIHAVAKDAYYSLEYAENVLKGPFSLGEPAIAKNIENSYFYARYIGKPFPLGEPTIAQDGWISLLYARDVLKKPFPLGEPRIATNAGLSYAYALYVLKKKPFPLGEPIIAKSSDNSYRYAKDVLKKPFPLGEPAIAKSPANSHRYAKYVLKGKPWTGLKKKKVDEALDPDFKFQMDRLLSMNWRGAVAENMLLKKFYRSNVYDSEAKGEDWINIATAWLESIKDYINKEHPELDLSDLDQLAYNMYTNHISKHKLTEDLRKWFKEKWVRFGPDGKIRGPCARGKKSEGKPKCLPQKKAHSLGKKKRASAAARKRREDPNPERSGKAKNVATKSKRDKK